MGNVAFDARTLILLQIGPYVSSSIQLLIETI